MAWSQVCGPTCSSWVLGSSGVSVAPFWPHPLLFSRLGFLPWAFVRTWVGRLRSCLGSYLLLGELSFPCPGFCWAVPAVWLSRLLVFSWNLYLGSFLLLPVFAAGLRWFRLILGCPPSVAWLWRLLPWFFVRYLSACPRGATVPLDSLVLRCSWSSRWVTFLRSGLCSSSVHYREVAFPPVGGFDFWPSCGVPCLRLTLWASACVGSGGCPAFSRVGPAPLSWVPLLWTWLVWEASTVFLLHCLPSGFGHP